MKIIGRTFMKHRKLWYMGSILIILLSFTINFGNSLQRKVLHEKLVYTTKKLPTVAYDKRSDELRNLGFAILSFPIVNCIDFISTALKNKKEA